jgi:hypothetical protein
MNLKEFVNELHFIADEHVRTRKFKTEQFILALNNENNLYFIDIETSSGTYPFVPEVTGDDYYLSRLENFVQQVLNDNKCIGKIQLPFNIADSLSQYIIICMQPCLKSQKFIYLDKEAEKMHQKDYEKKWKEKLLQKITDVGYLSLTDIINSSRGIRSANIRNKYLRELVQENKLEMICTGDYNRHPRTYYQVIQNENSTPNDSGTADTEAAGTEGQSGNVV